MWPARDAKIVRRVHFARCWRWWLFFSFSFFALLVLLLPLPLLSFRSFFAGLGVIIASMLSSSLRVLYTTGFSRWCPSCIIIIFQRDEFSLCCPAAAAAAVDLRRSTQAEREENIYEEKKIENETKIKKDTLWRTYDRPHRPNAKYDVQSIHYLLHMDMNVARARQIRYARWVNEFFFLSALDSFFFVMFIFTCEFVFGQTT